MKGCKVDGCARPHHAKGYCKLHYRQIVLAQRLENTFCSVPGCSKPVSYRFTKERLCEMHGTRLKRNGSTDKRQRERDIKSLISALLQSESPLDFDIENGTSYSEIARLYYGDYCHECGWNAGTCEAHHITPRSKGGKNTLRNTVVLCPNCHSLHHKNGHKRFKDKYKAELIEELKKIK